MGGGEKQKWKLYGLLVGEDLGNPSSGRTLQQPPRPLPRPPSVVATGVLCLRSSAAASQPATDRPLLSPPSRLTTHLCPLAKLEKYKL